MTSMDDTLADVLQECLDRLAGGATVEQCIQHFPQQSLELEPMLHAVAMLRTMPHPAMPIAAQAAIESRVLQQVALRRAPPPHAASQPAAHPLPAPLHGMPLWAVLVAVAIAVALLLALGLLLGGPADTPRSPATPLATALTQNPASPGPTSSLFSTPLPAAQQNDTTPTPTSQAASTPATPQATATGQPALLPVATTPPDAVLIPMATSTPAPVTGGGDGGSNGGTSSDGTSPGGDEGTSGGDSGSGDKTCRGQQIGRDEKKCEPLKPPPHGGDPSGPKDDNGGKKEK